MFRVSILPHCTIFIFNLRIVGLLHVDFEYLFVVVFEDVLDGVGEVWQEECEMFGLEDGVDFALYTVIIRVLSFEQNGAFTIYRANESHLSLGKYRCPFGGTYVWYLVAGME